MSIYHIYVYIAKYFVPLILHCSLTIPVDIGVLEVLFYFYYTSCLYRKPLIHWRLVHEVVNK